MKTSKPGEQPMMLTDETVDALAKVLLSVAEQQMLMEMSKASLKSDGVAGLTRSLTLSRASWLERLLSSMRKVVSQRNG
jgi:hypothetical protein